MGPGEGLAGLAGKRVMLGSAEADVIAFLRRVGIPPERLVVLPHSFNIQDLVSGRVDAMTGYVTNEPYYLEKAGFPYQMFSTRPAGVDFYGDILFTGEQEIREHPDRVKAFRAASMRGWEYAMAHPGEMADLILGQYSRRKGRDQLLFEGVQMVPLIQPDLVEMGYMNPDRWRSIGASFVALGMLPKDYSLEGFLFRPKPETDFRTVLRWIAGLFLAGAAIVAYQAHRANARFQAIFNSTHDAIFIHDAASGAVLDVNLRATELYGYPRELILAMSVEGLSSGQPPHTQADALGWIRKAAEGTPQVFEWQAKDHTGRVFWVDVNMRRTSIRGRGRLVVAVRDISSRKQAEQANAALQAQLQQAQRMESLGVLAGGVAHDMNNVLGAILAISSANEELQGHDSRARKAFATISQAAGRGGQMVQRLLGFARQAPAERRVLDVNETLREVAQLLERTTLATIQLRLDLAPDLRPVLGDASALAHTFMNLCVNGVDAMEGQGTLTLGTRNVAGDQVEITVEDTGCGMPPEILEKAMEPFFTTKPMGKGTGLGLSMSYSTLKAHHGHLEIQTEPGRGTRVILRLPAGAAEDRPPKPAPAARGGQEQHPLRVLLVDDDELVRDSIQEILKLLGHAATQAASGEQALAFLERGLLPDLVILDLNMPGLGGAKTLPRLRSLCPGVPVLLATGRADQSALDLVATHPGVTLMPKPFSSRTLMDHLKRIGLPGQGALAAPPLFP
jgi:PAS domain S-box-containing protein